MTNAKLYFLGEERELLWTSMSYDKFTCAKGSPRSDMEGGMITLVFTTQENDDVFMHNMTKEVELETDRMEDGEIHFWDKGFNEAVTRKYKFKDTYIVEFSEIFSTYHAGNMQTQLTISPAIQDYGAKLVKHWNKSWIPPSEPVPYQPQKEEEKEKRVILTFDANSSDIKEGKFGFDKFDSGLKKVFKGKDFTEFENEYNPILVYSEKYFPVWVSMRRGQTITLKINEDKRKNYELFNEIRFSENPDFTFVPANLKDAKEVQITCNNSGSQTQINIEGDGEVVGAINFFYPEPKEVNVRWVVVNFNEGDKDIIEGQIKIKNLKDYCKTAFNPALIDIKIVNENSENLDITLPVTNKPEQAHIDRMKTNLEVGKNDSVIQDDKNKINLTTALNTLHLLRQKRLQADEITLYLSNLKSGSITQSPTDSNKDLISSNNGATFGNLCLMFLGNDRQYMYPSVEIPHEIMHALGLKHTFDEREKYYFEGEMTKNYMDYSLEKEYTWKWQWDLLH
ncbi:type VI secretion system tube protein TssD [Flavobacterium aestivum]|uniref:type VI secretion system tube protein TssD n=1 Tax=Flavobacterium aestivum TaxID=3003257 RepID=UPI0024827C90|nr:type VI secretion system tube protein TssD [Flavobacterium aestivum]